MKIGSVVFAGFECDVIKASYHDNNTALLLVDSSDEDYGSPVLTASVNITGVSECLPEDQVVIKTYSENAGVLKALIEAGVVRDTGEAVATGYATCPVAEIIS